MENLISDHEAFEEVKKEGYFSTEREDGYVTRYSFQDWKDVSGVTNWDREILQRLERGKVLDLGCGSGKHVEYLTQHGFDALGIDISEEIIKLGKESNRNVKCLDFWEMDEAVKFDTIVIMDSSLGFFVSPNRLTDFFNRATKLLVEGGSVLITGLNWPEATNSTYKKYLLNNIENNFYPGRVKLRNKTENKIGDWFVGYYYDINSIVKKAVPNNFFPRWIGFHQGIKYAVQLKKNTSPFILK